MDVERELGDVRESIGLCQQSNIVIPELTVWEHFRLVLGLKGERMSKSEREEMIRVMVEETLGMSGDKEKRPSELSGGMQRKLCIGLGLVGSNKFIVLDEPTSGLDEVTRRNVWNIILSHKEGKVIILTTQHLDEADHLADRIGIMNNGKLLDTMVGTPLEIKKNFGHGYKLSVRAKQEGFGISTEQRKNIQLLVDTYVTENKYLTQSTPNLMLFQLPFHQMLHFTPLFRQLELLFTIALQFTSLEDAFLNIENIQYKDSLIEPPTRKKDISAHLTESLRSTSHDLLFTNGNLSQGYLYYIYIYIYD